MDDLTALHADASKSLADHTLHDAAHLRIERARGALPAAVLLTLKAGYRDRAPEVLAALEGDGLTLAVYTLDERPGGEVVDQLAEGNRMQVQRPEPSD